MTRPDIQIVSRYQISTHGTTQLRCVQPAEVLRGVGYSVSVQNLYKSRPVARKLIILHRVEMNRYAQYFITCAQARGIPLIYDTDDLVFDPDGIAYLSRGSKAASYAGGWKPYADAIKACDAVTVSTEFLAKRVRHITPQTHVVLNALGQGYLQRAQIVYEQRNTKTSSRITMAYLSGSNSHDADFASIEDALVQILHRHPTTRLLLVGPLEVSEKFAGFGDRIIRKGFMPYSDFPSIFEDIDINLIPLETDQAFCHAKSELKFIEAAACGVVSVASPTEPHKAAIRHGENGMLAKDNWKSCLEALIKDDAMRLRLGHDARKDILAYYTPQQRQQFWEQVITSVMANRTRRSVGYGRYLQSSAALMLKYTYRTAQTWIIKTRNSWTNR